MKEKLKIYINKTKGKIKWKKKYYRKYLQLKI